VGEAITFTAADGTGLAGERWPGKEPTFVLLHAGVSDRRAWSAVAAELSRSGADVVAYDRRGFGQTPAIGTPDHLGDLRSVLARATESPAWLVGNSQGGRIALDLALTDPGRVAGLVLIAPAVSGAPEPDDGVLDADTRRIDGDIEAAAAIGDIEAVNRLETHLWLDGPAGPEGRVRGPARDLALDMNAIALAARWPEGTEPTELDTWQRLDEVRAPATVVWGQLDLPFFVEQCRGLAERLPNLNGAIELPGTAHLPGLESPEQVAAVIREAAGG